MKNHDIKFISYFTYLKHPFFYLVGILIFEYFSYSVLAEGVRLPGVDASQKMESAATLLRFIDTGLFKWSARLLAGLCIFSAGWSLKEMRFGPAFISLIAAILFGTAPTWVKNIFTLGSSDSVFSSLNPKSLKLEDYEETHRA